ncbi:transcriptional regulator MntR [Alicyclobacillus sp. SP_1]|uniref:transcriptional regulator MntR n=1 Tax=Alicyclobacillus sp. SP_1 TaxID=2942475 RepID=UPI002158204B|nr:transcriptional regulator MntR [Alicyclobacillus sp. SP_1]
MSTTPSQEDYIETIWILIQDKGYARVTDIADRLGINNASVSKMIQKLDEDGLLVYERYRGLNLTEEGYSLGLQLSERHRTLEEFLRSMGMTNSHEINKTVEGIEHYFSADALERIENLMSFIAENPEWWDKFSHWSNGKK